MKERTALFDNAKAILIWLVVFGHLIDLVCASDSGDGIRYLFLVIWSFHMPAFIFLAGLFDHRRDAFPKGRVLYFVIVGLVLKIVNMLVLLVFPDVEADPFLFGDKNFPWFMFVLAAFVAMAYGLEKVGSELRQRGLLGDSVTSGYSPASGSKSGANGSEMTVNGTPAADRVYWGWVFAIVLAVSLAVGFLPWVGDVLYLSRIFVLFPVYVMGYMLQPADVVRVVERPAVRFAGAFGFVGMLAIFWVKLDLMYHLRPLFTGRNAYSAWGLAHGGPWLRLAAYAVSALMVFGFLCLVPRKESYLSRIGQGSLSVYVFHYYVIFLLDGLDIIDALATQRLRTMLPTFALIATVEVLVFSGKWLSDRLTKPITSYK
ncbi:MAG: hypothetical protein K5853_09300 [Lachnospiraceae bacterium]|nr:hypothetical protein [Lachnospiraceae bacterium]